MILNSRCALHVPLRLHQKKNLKTVNVVFVLTLRRGHLKSHLDFNKYPYCRRLWPIARNNSEKLFTENPLQTRGIWKCRLIVLVWTENILKLDFFQKRLRRDNHVVNRNPQRCTQACQQSACCGRKTFHFVELYGMRREDLEWKSWSKKYLCMRHFIGLETTTRATSLFPNTNKKYYIYIFACIFNICILCSLSQVTVVILF